MSYCIVKSNAVGELLCVCSTAVDVARGSGGNQFTRVFCLEKRSNNNNNQKKQVKGNFPSRYTLSCTIPNVVSTRRKKRRNLMHYLSKLSIMTPFSALVGFSLSFKRGERERKRETAGAELFTRRRAYAYNYQRNNNETKGKEKLP